MIRLIDQRSRHTAKGQGHRHLCEKIVWAITREWLDRTFYDGQLCSGL